MARLFTSGWELQDVLDGGAAFGSWDAVVGTSIAAVAGTAARTGERGLRVNPGAAAANSLEKRFAVDATTNDCYCRFYLYIQTSLSAQSTLLHGLDTLAVSFAVRLNTDNTLELWTNAAQIGSDSAALSTATWYRIEVGLVNSTGVVTAYVDGASFASGTVTAGREDVSFISLGLHTQNTTGEVYFDDVAVNTETGSVQNSLPGEGHDIVLMPNGDGDNAMGSRGGTDSGSDWGQVDEKPPNDVTDYYVLDVNNDIIDLNIEEAGVIPDGATIKLVQVGVRHMAVSASQLAYEARIKSQASGAVLTGTSTTHNDTTWKTNGDTAPLNYTLTSYTDPQAGGPWTKALLGTAQIGVRCTDATPDMRISTLWAYVEYMEVSATNLQDPILAGGVVPFPR
jgi:hypothetical protein